MVHSLKANVNSFAERHTVGMSDPCIESVILPVRPELTTEFERAFAAAVPIISRQNGFRRLNLSRCVERAHEYLLHVEWDSLADHTEGFRGSDDYQLWRAALHPFYDPVPQVDHFEPIITAGEPR